MQDLLAILIVAAAVAFLVRRAWLKITRRRGSACGSCAGCGAADSITSRPLVTLSTESFQKGSRQND
jgi:hypothetical protein